MTGPQQEDPEHQPSNAVPAAEVGPNLWRGWIVVLVVAGAAGVSQTFGRFAYSLLLTDVRDDFGLSNTVAGAFGTTNLAAYLTGTLIVSMTVARVGVARMTRGGIVVSTVGIGALAWSPNLWVLAVGQVVTGFGGAAVWVTAPTLATSGVGEGRRGLAIGLAGAGIGVGMVVSSAIEASVPTEQWRSVYRILAVVAVVVVVLALWFLRHGPAASNTGPSGFRALGSVPRWRSLLGAYALYGFSMSLFLNYLVASLEDDSGYTATEAAAAFSAFGAGTIVGGPSFGPLSDRWGRRRSLVAAYVLMVVAALVVPTGARPWSTVAAFAFGTAFTGVPTGVAARIRDHVDGAAFGGAFGTATLGFGAALMLGPQLGGALGDLRGSFQLVFVTSAAAAVAGAALAWRGTAAGRACD